MLPSIEEMIIHKIKDLGLGLSEENTTEVIAITKERMAVKNCSVDEAFQFTLKWLDLALR